ncbi:hypothetical protein AVEN_219823-1 [Araneus ventricosus]|uniref:Uncharacterized protein n=1 Tax=Araneus ventricosus TaxID=182803 RepID=A0A4Y2IVP4_ARAVE|nr:hypothetical protein AVEN_219823-1 [Araneus ventricosus]
MEKQAGVFSTFCLKSKQLLLLQKPEIMFVTGHGPFPTYLKRFKIRNSDSCGCGNPGNPLYYATSCLFTTSCHLTKPSAGLEPLWWERGMNNNNSREKIRKLIHFIAEKESLFFPKDGDNNYPQTQLTLGSSSKFLVSSEPQVTPNTISSSLKTSQHPNAESWLIDCSTASSSTFSEQSNWSLAGLKVGWTSLIQ